MSQNFETKRNLEIESCNPTYTALHKTFSGSVWRREWVCENNDIGVDYVVYIGSRSKPPTADKFGFKQGSYSIYRRAFRFSQLAGALAFAERHSIVEEEE
jgi:hypothetical protein